MFFMGFLLFPLQHFMHKLKIYWKTGSLKGLTFRQWYTMGVNPPPSSRKWTKKVLKSCWKWREAARPKQIPNPWNITSLMNDGISPVSSISALPCLALVTAVGTRGPWNTLLPLIHTHTHAHLHTRLANDRLSNQHSLLINYIAVHIHTLSLSPRTDTDVSSLNTSCAVCCVAMMICIYMSINIRVCVLGERDWE